MDEVDNMHASQLKHETPISFSTCQYLCYK